MRKRYCFYGCSGVSRLHMFPTGERDQERRAEWLKIVGLDSDDNRKGLFLCARHFSETRPDFKKLPSSAVPDMNLCHQPGSREAQHTTSALPTKLLTPVQTTRKSFVYVLEPPNEVGNRESVPARSYSMVASPDVNTAAANKNNAPAPKNFAHITGSASSGISKLFPLKRPSAPLTSNLNATSSAPKKLFSVLRPPFAAAQPAMRSNTTKSFNNQRVLDNVEVNSNAEPRASASSSTRFVISTNSKPTNVNNSSQNLHQGAHFNTCPTTAKARVQTKPKTFVIVRPPAKEANTSEALKRFTAPSPRSIPNSGIPMVSIAKSTANTRSKDNTSVNNGVTISAAPQPKLLSVLRTSSSSTNGCNSGNTILIPQNIIWKPRKFIIKREDVKQLPVAPTNSATKLRKIAPKITSGLNIVLSTPASFSTALVNPAAHGVTPGNLATGSTAVAYTPTVNATSVNPTINNITTFNPSTAKVSPINTILQPIPVAKDNSGCSSFIAPNPTMQSTTAFSDSSTSHFNPSVFAKPEIRPILQQPRFTKKPSNATPPISYAALSIFMPESEGYRVNASSIKTAVDPLAIDDRISNLARVIIDRYQAKSASNISTSPCHKPTHETAQKDNEKRSIDEISESSMRANNACNCEKSKFADEKITTTVNEFVPLNNQESQLELQKQILCLKQKLESKETELTTLRSIMLNIAAK